MNFTFFFRTRCILLVYWLLLLLASQTETLTAQCLTPDLVMINSCITHPNPNGSGIPVESEILIVSSGITEVPVSTIGVDMPFNGFGAVNEDLGVRTNGMPFGCNFKEPTVTSLSGCPNAIPLGPLDVIPPNAAVVIFVNGLTTTPDAEEMDFTNLCLDGEPIYILQSECERTTSAFANRPGAGDPLRFINITSPCGSRGFTYNTEDLDPNPGTYFLVGPTETGNLDCAFPVIPDVCPPLDTAFTICNAGPVVSPPISTDEFRVIYPPSVLAVTFFPTAAQAEINQGRIENYSNTTDQTDTLFARVVYAENLCIVVSRLVIRFQDGVSVTNPPSGPARGCDQDFDGIGLFNLRLLDAEIGNGQPVTYFLDAEGTMPIANPTDYESPAGTLYAAAGLGNCQGDIIPISLELIDGPLVITETEATSCSGNEDGLISFEVSGFGPFAYRWSNSEYNGLSEADSLPAGRYRVTITDAWGCAVTERPRVSDGTATQLSCSISRAATGETTSDGIINLEITEGRGPFQLTYTFVGADAGAREIVGSNVQLDNLVSGSYTFLVTDADGCTTETCTVNLPFNDPLTLACSLRNDSNGGSVSGAITTNIAGGQPPYSLTTTRIPGGAFSTLSNLPGGEQVIDGLNAGNYRIVVTDANGITAECEQTVGNTPCPLRVVEVSVFQGDCSVADGFVIQLSLAGAAGNVTTVWSGEPGVDQFNGQQEAGPLGPGTYFVDINDDSGCPLITEGPIVITPPTPTEFTTSQQLENNACSRDGRIDVEITAGEGPFTVQLFAADGITLLDELVIVEIGTPVTFSGLAAGPGDQRYFISFSNSLGCPTEPNEVILSGGGPVTITLPDEFQSIISPTCTGDTSGVIELAASGGTSPYTYVWTDNPPLANGRTLTPGARQDNLPAGNYGIEITDANGCTGSETITLQEGDTPTITCAGTMDERGTTPGAARFIIAGGLPSYIINITQAGTSTSYANRSAGDNTVTPLAAGDYLASVTDANGCTSEACPFTILSDCASRAPMVSLENPIHLPFCVGQEVSIPLQFSGQGPYRINFSFDQAPEPIRELAYRATGATDTLRFTPPPPDADGRIPFLVTFIFNESDCPTRVWEQYFLTPFIPDTIRRTDTICGDSPQLIGGRTFTPELPAAEFSVVGTGACDTHYSVALTFLTDADAIIQRTDTLCEQSDIMIGGRLFSPNNPSDTFTINVASGCQQRYEVDLTFGNFQIPDTLTVDICPATPYELNGEVFDASRPEGPVTFNRPGLCDSMVYVRLNIAPEFFGTYGESRCVGDTVRYGGRVFTAENPAGLARLPGMAASGCDSLVVVTNSFQRTGEVRLFGDFDICPGDSVELRFTYDGPSSIDVMLIDDRGNTRQLNNIRRGSRVVVYPTESTTYRLLSASTSRCSGTVAGQSTVVVNDLMGEAEVLTNPGDFCADTLGRAVVSYSGGISPYNIEWSNGPADSINRNLLPGTYLVTVTDAAGCTFEDSVTLSPRIPLDVALSGVAPLCPGESGSVVVDSIIGGSGFYELSLDGTFFVPITNVDQLTPVVGNNRAFVQDAGDCTAEVNFFVPPAISINDDFLRDTTIKLGDSLFLDPGEIPGLDTAFWTPSLGLRTPGSLRTVAIPQSSTDYTLHLRTVALCEFTFRISITVDERLPVYMPTAFSPNGDEVNELFAPGLGAGVEAVERFQIFNRWGTLVHDANDAWDGRYNNQEAPVGVYVYQLRVRLVDGSSRVVKGDLVLTR